MRSLLTLTPAAVAPAVFLLGLLACGEPAPAATGTDTVDTGTPPYDPYADGLVGDPEDGAARFVPRCATCHGEDGRGRLGPDLATRVPLYDDLELYRVITEGRNGMPAVAVEPQEGVDIVAWLRDTFDP